MYNFLWFSLFIAINALLLAALAINISIIRIKNKISYGDGGNKQLLKAIRVHSNGVEQVPIYALLLLALSLNQTSPLILAGLVISFTLCRFSHAIGMIFRIHRARRLGAGGTYLLQLMTAVLILIVSF